MEYRNISESTQTHTRIEKTMPKIVALSFYIPFREKEVKTTIFIPYYGNNDALKGLVSRYNKGFKSRYRVPLVRSSAIRKSH